MSPDISKSGSILVSRMKLQTDIWKFRGRRFAQRERAPRNSCDATDWTGPHSRRQSRRQRGCVSVRQRRTCKPVGREHRSGGLRQITHEHDPNVALGVPLWSPEGHTIAFVSSRGNQGLACGWWIRMEVTCAMSRTPVSALPGRRTAAGYITRHGAAREPSLSRLKKRLSMEGQPSL